MALNKLRQVEINNLVLDLGGVVFHSRYEFLANIAGLSMEKAERMYFSSKFNPDTQEFWQQIITKLKLELDAETVTLQAKEFGQTVRQEVLDFILEQKETKQIYYLTNTTVEHLENFKNNEIIQHFNGGLGDCELGISKPDLRIYHELLQKFGLENEKTLFIDDFEANVEAARESGMWGIVYKPNQTELEFELDRIEQGNVPRIPKIPKILFLGKPNVGKSSLFNAMVGKDIQIVTDLPGTTLSVNDVVVER